jgi:hypothetical protein
MLFSTIAFIGVDPAPGRKSIHYAALGPDMEILSLGAGDLNAVNTFLSGHQQAVIAVHGPSRPNQQILTDAERREQYLIPLSVGRPGNMRVAEYHLRQRGLPCYQTPAEAGAAQVWMQTGFRLWEGLRKSGCQPWTPEEEHPRQTLEVIPELGYRAWLEGNLLPANTLFGRLQRQMILYERGLQIPDPMDFFEEVTRFRLLHGTVSQDLVYSAGALSALAAAFLAWQARHEPDQLTAVGLPQEGLIHLPASLIQD